MDNQLLINTLKFTIMKAIKTVKTEDANMEKTNKCINCKHAKIFYDGLRCNLEWRLHSLNKEACACFSTK